MPKTTSYKSGLLAETIAIILLTLKLYRVIEKRYKTKTGEIDIIAVRARTIVFVEVKKRRNRQELFECITPKQQQRIYSAAENFLTRNQIYAHYQKRFDAILVLKKHLPIHIKNAW